MNKVSTFMRDSMTTMFFIPLGIILIIFGIAMFVINNKNSNYIETEAIVTKTELIEEEHSDANGDHVDATYNVYIKYTVNDNEYNELLGELSGYKEGEKIKIYYDPSDPSKITQTKSLIFPIIFVIGGVVSLVGGVLSGVSSYKRHKKMKEQEKGWEKNE